MHNTDLVPNPLLTSKQVADRLGVSVSTISRLVASGRLKPALRLDGIRGAMWFKPADLNRYERAKAKAS